ncbi:MAG: hypothetical protein E6I76_00705 [Chloroflexi bacterium]|nr:MAG: hypothetical protein E6I76_00705 [Chloroflexota bacterium]
MWRRTFGFHPMLCDLDGSSEPLGGRLRPGNATANDAQDQLDALDDALAHLPTQESAEPILVRGDSASGTHAFRRGSPNSRPAVFRRHGDPRERPCRCRARFPHAA